MDCGEPEALSVKLSVPDLAPIAVGVNETLIVQEALAARDAGQVLDCPKSPVVAMLVIDSEALPVFCNVTDCVALVVFIT